ncbi:MAG: hypothetical protein K9J37_09025 [Saprospiraceae bacterium]|nr:hypothetical protein [Saprospiraceae bacterium]MCF8250044.1 hypothetical protein [Saprospiraceae bacterium]MCF8283299.1 hypothetical protein [Bacteroidales bacterium]MCF8311990.1 hypothetical protein [Saprospiraceae bacterium]MCF8440320.1 hypothetical protein [Saprospiraceae bacterium]
MNLDRTRRRLLANSVFRTYRNMRQAGAVLYVRGPEFKKATASRLRRAARMPRLMLWAFMMESIETKNMVRTFVKQGKGQILLSKQSEPPTEEEIRDAMEQLKDLPKFLPFFIFIAVPVPGVTESYVLLAVSLEKWLGQKFSLLPSHFRAAFQKKDTDISKRPPELPDSITD